VTKLNKVGTISHAETALLLNGIIEPSGIGVRAARWCEFCKP